MTGFEPNVVFVLIRGRFDVLILHGYNSSTNLLALIVVKIIGTSVIIRGDTRLQRRHDQASFAKRIFKKILFKFFDGFLSIGSLNRAYYLTFGVRRERIFFSPFCVDNASFALNVTQRQFQRQDFRGKHGLPTNAVVILFASKFVKRKRPSDLIQAFGRIATQFPEAWLVMAGFGEQEAELNKLVSVLAIGRVRFVGFQNQTALPALYAASDLFVLPAEAEPWGLVVNEVMAAGLPVIVSDEVGAAPDLVHDAGTGIVYPSGDVEALSQALVRLLESDHRRQEMGRQARDLIQKWDVAACAESTVKAVMIVAHC